MALSLLETTFRERRGGFGTLIEPPCSTRALVFGPGAFFWPHHGKTSLLSLVLNLLLGEIALC